MNKAVEKFIKLIEEEIKNMKKNIFILSKSNRGVTKEDIEGFRDIVKDKEVFVDWLKNPFDGDYDIGKIFVNFEGLSETLKENPLKLKETFEIVMFVIAKNIKIGILLINVCDFYFNMDIINKFHFKSAPKEEVLAFAHSKKFLYSPIKKDLTPQEKEMYQELLIVSQKSIAHVKSEVDGHEILNKYLLSKFPNIQKEDIPLIMEGFTKCGFTPKVLQDLETYLNILIDKKKDPIIVPVKEKCLNTPQLSSKELKVLNKELSYYYDFDSDKIIRELTLDEELHVINLMQRLGFREEKITNILDRAKNVISLNPIVLYARLYNKYEAFSDNEKVKALLQELEMYFQNIFMGGDEDYEIAKICFLDTFNELEEAIPHNYEYEFEVARTLTKTNRVI